MSRVAALVYKLCSLSDVTDYILQVGKWQDILLQVLVSEQADIQHRATHLVCNMMESSKDVTQEIVSSQLFEILMAITKLEGEQNQGSRTCAEAALKTAAKHGFAKAL